MALKLSAIQEPQDVREITLDFGDAGTIEMTVDPNRFNIGRQRKLRQAIKDNDTAAQADILFDAVQSWDLTDDDGEPLPLDESGIDHLTVDTVLAIATKMSEALGVPKSGTSTESPAHSPTPISTRSTSNKGSKSRSRTTSNS